MNSQEQDHTPSFELPMAAGSEKQNTSSLEQGDSAMTEVRGALAVEQGKTGLAASATAIPPSVPPTVPDGPAAQALTSSSTPQIADDNDLIEKEWVMKAKEIVAQTAHDPHMQNKAMSRFKADYLKKRYNKDIKLSEDM